MKLRIGILGTRGIPNHYGGFEQFASFLSVALVQRGHQVTVYNTSDHPCREKEWEGVEIVHRYDPKWMGTAGQFIYDLLCICHARKKSFDIILFLGYTSSSIWSRYCPSRAKILTNMDGLEWKRAKYPAFVKRFLRYAEKLAVQYSDQLIADALPIQEYLYDRYKTHAAYISYGATVKTETDPQLLQLYAIEAGNYFLLIARMEPENHIETILSALVKDPQQRKILVIGSLTNRYGKKVQATFSGYRQIIFTGAIYETPVLDALRAHCAFYFHGHSVGGTNPSLLEAMACGALICAHDNIFNRAVLGEEAWYFQSAEDIVTLVAAGIQEDTKTIRRRVLQEKIAAKHSWSAIVDGYENLFIQSMNAHE